MSVLSRRGKLLPMRVGFYREGKAFLPNLLLSAVEPPAADILELKKLAAFSGKIVYHASRNRQCHTYALTERRDTRSLALKRVFSRCDDPMRNLPAGYHQSEDNTFKAAPMQCCILMNTSSGSL